MLKKKTSQKQIRANGRNALKSTGPRTPEGKGVARWNALEHGLLSKEVVIKTGGGKESGAAFRKLLTQLREDLQPDGILEEMLVERIAACYWRLRRVLRCEVGEIRKDLDQIRLGDTQGADRPHRLDDREITRLVRQVSEPALKTLQAINEKHRRAGLALYRPQLRDELDDAALQELGGERPDESEAEVAMEHSTQASQDSGSENRYGGVEGSESSSPEDPEASRELSTELVGSRNDSAEETRPNTRNDPAYLELEAKHLRLSLPAKEAVEKILRYETAIERQLDRAINQLERLQRRRRGDIVPPPIHVELSTE